MTRGHRFHPDDPPRRVAMASIVHAPGVVFRCKIKSPVTPRECHLSLGARSLLAVRNEDMLSLPAGDVTPSQTTGFISATPGICHTAPAQVSNRRYKVAANMARGARCALIQKTRRLSCTPGTTFTE